MKKEDLSGQINGIRQRFTVSVAFQASSIRVYYNGVRQSDDEVTVIDSLNFDLNFIPELGDDLTIDFYSQ